MPKKASPSMAPTMIDVARLAGVSTMTVSRTLRDESLVSLRTRNKVRKAIDELGYVLDQSAGALSSRRTGFVACTVPSLNNSNFSDTARGITETLAEANVPSGLQLILAYTDYSVEKEEKLVEALLRRRPEAFIITGGNHSERTRRMLQSSQIPVVQIWDAPQQAIEHVVGFSNAAACAELVNYLYQRGYRKLGFVGSSLSRDTRGADRQRGFIETTQALGIACNRIVNSGSAPITVQQGGPALLEILQRWPDTDAIVFVSDLPAVGALAECTRRGWQVPQQVAIAGFGDFDVAACAYPALTTVSIDCYGIGEAAAKVVQQAIMAKRADNRLNAQILSAEHRVLARESA